MATITPNIWFDNQSEEAVNFYISIFDNSKIIRIDRYSEAGQEFHKQKPGSVMNIEFTLANQHFIAINGGPIFKLNPAISFYVACESNEEVDSIFKKLSEGGSIMMELGEHPFSSYYTWFNDKYGVSWQLNKNCEQIKQKISPSLLFTQDKCGKAESAINLYSEVFPASKPDIVKYGPNMEPNSENGICFSSFTILGYEIHLMDSGLPHAFTFNESISLMLTVDDQKEIDQYWAALSAVPECENCGWLKDKFGVSWQIVPKVMNDMLVNGTPEQISRVTAAFMVMKKFDVQKLIDAYGK